MFYLTLFIIGVLACFLQSKKTRENEKEKKHQNALWKLAGIKEIINERVR